MKALLPLFGLTLVYGCNSSSKEEVSAKIEEEDIVGDYDAVCIYHTNSAKTDTTFPFNEADKIELVSFDDTISYEGREDEFTENNVKIENGKFEIRCLTERAEINKVQIDSLFSILYKHIPEGNGYSASPCYNPRHAVLFYKKHKPLAFLEICLECSQIRTDDKWEAGNFCSNTWAMLEDYFKWAGIKKGFR